MKIAILLVLVLVLAGCVDKGVEPQAETLVRTHAIGCDEWNTTFLGADGTLRLVNWAEGHARPQCHTWNASTYWDVTILVYSDASVFVKARIAK